MIAPILVVCVAAFAAILDTSNHVTPPPAPNPTITIPANATITIENATIQLNAKEEDKGSWLSSLFSGTTLTVVGGIAVAVIAGRYANRTAILQEKRLRVETFNKSAELMKRKDGDRVGPNEGAATVFSLVKLDEYDYALEMIRTLWPENGITSTAAVWTINKILELPPERNLLKDYAANALWQNAKRLGDRFGSFDWPSAVEWKWPNDLTPYARACVLQAVLELLTSRYLPQWNKRWIDSLLNTLEAARKNDELDLHRYCAARIEKAVLEKYRYDGRIVTLEEGRTPVDELLKSVDETIKSTNSTDTDMDEDFLIGIRYLKSQWESPPAPPNDTGIA